MAYTAVEYSAGQGVKRHLRSINAVYGEKTASAVGLCRIWRKTASAVD